MPVNPNQLFLQGGNYYAVNPATGQAEPVFQDLNEPNPQATGGTEYAGPQFQPTYYFQSDLPSGAIPIALQKDTPSNVALGLAPIIAGMGAGALLGAPAGAAGGVVEAAAGDVALAGTNVGASGVTDTLATGALDAGMDLGMYGTAANPYATGALGADALAATEAAAAAGGGVTAASTLPAGGLATGPGTGLGTLGTLGATALGVIGANNAANAYGDLSGQLREDRLPFLNQSVDWLNNPQAYFEGPGQAALQGNLRALSIYGNPAGNPWAIETANEAALRQWQNTVLGFGNVGLGGQGIQAQLGGQEIGAESGVYNALGSGLANLTNPQPTLEQLLAQFRSAGGSSVSL